MEQFLEFKKISKAFPGVQALDNVSFRADGGRVCALMGENGAGKSTLLKILSGDLQPDEGHVCINGEVKSFASPYQSIKSSISVILRTPLMPAMSVMETYSDDLTKTGLVYQAAVAPEDTGNNRCFRATDKADRYGTLVGRTSADD